MISEATYHEKLRGSLITDVENFARRWAFQTESGQGTIDKLKDCIHQKKPVIVLVDLGFWITSRPHYLIVFGYSDEGLIAPDGEKPSQLYRTSDFEKVWEKMGRAYLLVYR